MIDYELNELGDKMNKIEKINGSLPYYGTVHTISQVPIEDKINEIIDVINNLSQEITTIKCDLAIQKGYNKGFSEALEFRIERIENLLVI